MMQLMQRAERWGFPIKIKTGNTPRNNPRQTAAGGHARSQRIGGYTLVEKLGAGGMGEVWQAEHRALSRSVAIKFLHPHAPQSDTSAEVVQKRFEREARATALLRSPHTVTVYDFGREQDGSLYYVMELLDGWDLQKLVQQFGPLPPERVVHFLRQACDSLGEAHLHGLVHRDIKPQNIFVCHLGQSYDFIKILDFGLVKSRFTQGNAAERITIEEVITGTPAYMSPEQAMGKSDIDFRADIYSLGCVAYWLLTGELVFPREETLSMLMAHIQDTPAPPSERTEAQIPRRLDEIILACLEKNPNRRPQSAQELAHLLSPVCLDKSWSKQQAESWWESHAPSKPRAEAALSTQ